MELLGFKTIPIINTNDVVVSPSEPDSVYEKQIPPESKEVVSADRTVAWSKCLATVHSCNR